MVEVRHATKVQPKGSEGTRAPETDSIVSPSLGSVLSRSGQTGRVRCNGRSASSKTMHSRDVSHRVRFFLPGIPSTEKVRGLETSDRSLKAKRVPDPSHVSNGHASEGKGGRRAGHVCHLPRPIRRIPPRSDARGLTRIPLFSSQRQEIHVPGSSFGLMTAPWAFTQVVKQIKIWSSRHHLILFQYLDDWLNLFKSLGRARVWTLRLVRLCEQLGLLVNQEKSELQPTQSIVFLGERLDLLQGRAFPTEERRQVVVPALEQALSHHGLEFPAAESLLGLLSATAPTIPLGRMHMRPFQLDVIRQVRIERNGRAWIPVTGQSAQALQWWTHGPHWEIGIPIPSRTPTGDRVHRRVIQGMGCSVQRDHVEWDMAKIRSPHQLAGAGSCVSRNPTSPVQVERKDDALYDRQRDDGFLPKETGGERSRALHKLSMRILRLAHRLQITMVPRHIAGQLNVLADLASRAGQVIPSEWSLSTKSFQWIIKRSPWGPPQVDMFANSLNFKLKDYILPCPDPQALAIDALNCQWPVEVIYAFPPACIIQQFLLRLKVERQFKILLVVP